MMRFALKVPPTEVGFWAAEYDKHYDDSATELISRRDQWPGFDDVKYATLGWEAWSNQQRLLPQLLAEITVAPSSEAGAE